MLFICVMDNDFIEIETNQCQCKKADRLSHRVDQRLMIQCVNNLECEYATTMHGIWKTTSCNQTPQVHVESWSRSRFRANQINPIRRSLFNRCLWTIFLLPSSQGARMIRFSLPRECFYFTYSYINLLICKGFLIQFSVCNLLWWRESHDVDTQKYVVLFLSFIAEDMGKFSTVVKHHSSLILSGSPWWLMNNQSILLLQQFLAIIQEPQRLAWRLFMAGLRPYITDL